jgi:DNA polymerase-3 subunit gamma/tau
MLFQADPAATKTQTTTGKLPASSQDSDRRGQKETEIPAAGDSGVTLGRVSKAWKQICAEVKTIDPNLNALLNSCHPVEVKKDVLVLGFASDILRSKADTPEQMEITCKAVAKVVGENVSIKCVISTTKHSTPPDVKADGMVAAALKAGGEIVDIQE